MTQLTVTPDWTDGIGESYEFSTEIFTSRNGREQRRAMRQTPRMGITFSAMLTQNEMRKFQYDKLLAGGDPVTCGRFGFNQYIFGRVSSAIVAVSASDAPATGLYAIYSGLQIEYVTASSVVAVDPWSSGYGEGFGPFEWHITLSLPLSQDWSGGGIMVPAVQGRIGQRSNFEPLTDSLAMAELRIDLLPGAYPAPYASLTYGTLGGIPVMDASPDWGLPMSPAVAFPYEMVDFGLGRTLSYEPVDFLTRIMNFVLTFEHRVDADRLIGHFGKMKGRRGEFYCPTWLADLTPLRGIQVGATSVFVSEHFVFEDTVHSAIYVALKQGGGFAVMVSDVSPAMPDPGGYSEGFDDGYDIGIPADSTELTLAAGFPASVSRHDIAMICWMPICRFASDELSVSRITDERTRITVNVMSLETL